MNYAQLNSLQQVLGGQGLQVLAFPSAQFYNQEPGANAEILNCLKYVRPGNGFVPAFPLFAKADVNGANRMPLYDWLTTACPNTQDVISTESNLIAWQPVKTTDIIWNFEKFLLDKKGAVFKRYSVDTPPLAIQPDIEKLLAQ